MLIVLTNGIVTLSRDASQSSNDRIIIRGASIRDVMAFTDLMDEPRPSVQVDPVRRPDAYYVQVKADRAAAAAARYIIGGIVHESFPPDGIDFTDRILLALRLPASLFKRRAKRRRAG